MRFFAPLLALFAAVASAQQYNAPKIPDGGLQVTAGSNTISWDMPSSGTVTIKLQLFGQTSTPNSGIIVASGISASAGTATVNIPAGDVVPGTQYVYEIIDDTGAHPSNFSNEFTISGATGTATATTDTNTDTTMTMTGTSTDATMTITNTNTNTDTTATDTSTSSTPRGRTSTTSSSPSATSSTAPNAGSKLIGAQGGLFVLLAGAVAVL